jgi:sugar lactone lactonase YvrE
MTITRIRSIGYPLSEAAAPSTRQRYYREFIGLALVCMFSVAVPAHTGSGIAVDRAGQVFFLDTGSGTWRIDPNGGVRHLSPLRNHWLALDPTDRFTSGTLPTDPAGDWVLTRVGSNPTVLISTDFPVAIGQDGALYYPPRRPHLQLTRTDPSGRTSVFASLPRPRSGESHINGITAAPDGSFYYTEDSAIHRIDNDGKVTLAATVTRLAKGPQIRDTDLHPYLRGLAVDAKGTMYVADNGDARVLKITPQGQVTTLLQLESPWAPTAVALHGGILYVMEFLHTPGDDRTMWMPRIRRITPDGKSTVILTVDQMPGARSDGAPRTPAPGSSGIFGLELNKLLTKPFDLIRLFSPPFPAG